jgi:hypothetical protein
MKETILADLASARSAQTVTAQKLAMVEEDARRQQV